jgi:hypothetical protein
MRHVLGRNYQKDSCWMKKFHPNTLLTVKIFKIQLIY